MFLGFPCGSADKEFACNAGDLGPSLGWEDPLEKRKATYSIVWPGEFHGLYSPWGHKESDTTERFSFHFTLLPFPLFFLRFCCCLFFLHAQARQSISMVFLMPGVELDRKHSRGNPYHSSVILKSSIISL